MTALDLTILKKDRLELRDYQILAAEASLKQNTLIVMPTALGKTFIAALVIAHVLQTSPKKILFLAPTKPLALQQCDRLKELLDLPEEQIIVVTGEINPAKREEIYKNSRIIVGTPQTISNDVLTGKLILQEFSLAVFDEAHRAVGDYAYSFLGQQVQIEKMHVIGLTASPSSEREKIEEICRNLGTKHIELKTERDDDVRDYVKKVDLKWEFVDLPQEILDVKKTLQDILRDSLSMLKENGYLESADTRINKRDLLMLRPKIVGSIQSNPKAYSALSELAKAMNLTHAIDLLESEGIAALKNFIAGMDERKEKTKAIRSLLSDFRLTKVKSNCETLLQRGFEHPKMARLKQIITDATSQGKTIIVFAHYRDSVKNIVVELNKITGVNAKALVGRSGEEGMSQKKQAALLEDFRNKQFNVMLSTSVGEEGLDIPAVDLVVFYEAVPSEIRTIQRRGRAGRIKAGGAIVLVAKNTKDEAFFWISKRKEKLMHEQIGEVSKNLHNEGQKTMGDY